MFSNFTETAKNIFYNKKFIIVLVLAALFTGIAFYFYNSYVAPRLNPDFVPNKEFTSDDSPNAELIYFFTDWCPYCKKARPTWEKMKKQYDNKLINGKTVYFKEVDCEKEEKMADQYNIEGYPTIKLIKDDQVVDYDAKPTEKNLVEFLTTSV